MHLTKNLMVFKICCILAGIFQKFLKFVKIDLKLKEIMNLIKKLLTAWLWEQFHKLEFVLYMY